MAESLRAGCPSACQGLASEPRYWRIREYRAGACLQALVRILSGLLSATAACTVANPTGFRGPMTTSPCDVVRFFTEQKCRMMPYLYRGSGARQRSRYANDAGDDVEFPDDPA